MNKLIILLSLIAVGARADFNVDFNCDTFLAVGATVDPTVSSSDNDGNSLSLLDPSATSGIDKFEFDISGHFELNDTSATLSGKLLPAGATGKNDGFYFVLSLSLATDTFSGRIMLNPDVQVNTSAWQFFAVVPPSYLSGFGSFAGAEYQLQQLVNSLPLQVGQGANGRNLNFGASVAVDIAVGQFHIAGEISVDLQCLLTQSSSSSSEPSSSSSSSDSSSSPSSSSSSDSSSSSSSDASPSSSSSSSSSDSSSSSSQSSSSQSSSEAPGACAVSVSLNVANAWLENGRNTTLVYVTLTNTGSLAIADVALTFDQHGDDCSGFASSCIRQFWSLSTGCATNSNLGACSFGLPDWLAEYGGLQVGAALNWGFISYSSRTDITVVPTCITPTI